MQKKIGTVLDEDLLKKVRQKALAKHTTLNRIFEEALSEYLSREIGSKQKLSAVDLSFGVIPLPSKTVQKIVQEDIYEAE